MITSSTARVIYSTYNCATTNYVYTSVGSTGADDGWVQSEADYVSLQIGLSTKTATVEYRLEGRNEGHNRAASILSGEVSDTTIDDVVIVNPHYKRMRLAVRASSVASPATDVNAVEAALILAEVK